MKKIYIAGCGGMLGEAFYKQFKKDYILKCTDKDVNENWLSYLDFRDRDNYLNPHEAIDLGLIDNVIEKNKVV